jgi:hypothetical protein
MLLAGVQNLPRPDRGAGRFCHQGRETPRQAQDGALGLRFQQLFSVPI